MKKLLLLLAAFVFAASLARAGNVTTYPNVSSVTSADLFFDWQSGTQQNATAAQLKTYLLGGGTLSIASGKTLAANNTVTFTGTDDSSVAFGSGGTVLYASGIGSSVEAWSARLDALAALSPPATSGYLLSSNASGGLSWIAPTVTATASGTNTYTATPSPALTAYTTGLSVLVKFTNANTAGSSLNLNSLGAIPIEQSGAAVTAGQIPVGSTLYLVYDGTNFQIVGNNSGSYSFTSPLVNTTGTVALTVGSSGGVEAWNANLDTLAVGNPLTAGSNITFSGTWPNVTIAAAGSTYTLPAATTGSLGGVIPDGVTITVDGFGDIAVGSVPSYDITGLPTFPGSAIVGISDTQTLTNKSIASTEITGVTFPSSAIVGISDSQTLTNKSIAASEINSGTLTVAQGGTGASALTAYAPLFGGTSSSAPIQSGTVGTAGQALISNGPGALPTFQTPAATPYTIVNSTGTTVAGNTIVILDPYSGSGHAMTTSLPASPANGMWVTFVDVYGAGRLPYGFAAYNQTISGNGIGITSTSSSVASTYTLNQNYQVATFVYESWANTWLLTDYVATPPHVPGTPTIATSSGAGAGTGPTLSVSGSDVSGLVTVTTGSGPITGATVAQITYNTGYATAPNSVTLTPANAAAAALSGATNVYMSVSNPTSFVITSGSSALTASTQYKWWYSVSQQ